MALDTIRQVLGQTAMRGLQERSATGRAALLGQQLQNALQARQLDDLFPLQIQKLQKEVAGILDPQAAVDLALGEYSRKKAIEQQTEEAMAKFRGGIEAGLIKVRQDAENGPMSADRFAQEKALRQASLYNQPRQVQTEALLVDAQGKPSATPHMWTIKPDGTRGNYLGPTQGRASAAEAKTSPTLLKEMRLSQTGKSNAKGEIVQEASEELTQLRQEIGKKKDTKLWFIKTGQEPAMGADEFFDQLVASGWPKSQSDVNKYPGLAQAVAEWRNSLSTIGPSEMMLQGGGNAPGETVQFNGMTFQRNPDGSLTRVQ